MSTEPYHRALDRNRDHRLAAADGLRAAQHQLGPRHRDDADAQQRHLLNRGSDAGLSEKQRRQAAATFNVPARAGEASTMTGGVPNMVTDNERKILGSYTIPYAAVSTGTPYYVFSY